MNCEVNCYKMTSDLRKPIFSGLSHVLLTQLMRSELVIQFGGPMQVITGALFPSLP